MGKYLRFIGTIEIICSVFGAFALIKEAFTDSLVVFEFGTPFLSVIQTILNIIIVVAYIIIAPSLGVLFFVVARLKEQMDDYDTESEIVQDNSSANLNNNNTDWYCTSCGHKNKAESNVCANCCGKRK